MESKETTFWLNMPCLWSFSLSAMYRSANVNWQQSHTHTHTHISSLAISQINLR